MNSKDSLENNASATYDICYLVSHGFTSRGLFQTGLLNRLVERGLKVAVVCKKIEPHLKQKCEEVGADLFEYPFNKGRLEYHFQISRKYFLEDIRNNPALWDKHRHRIQGNTLKRLLAYVYFLIYLVCHNFPVLRRLYRKLESWFLTSKRAEELLVQLSPAIVVSTRPVELLEAYFLKAATKLNIKKVFAILSWDNITCKGIFPVAADEYLTWGPIMEAEVKEYYKAGSDHIKACGVPHFDVHYKNSVETIENRVLDNFGLNPAKPYLFFAMSSPYFAPNEIDVIEWMAEQVNKGHWGKDMQLLVRPHIQNVIGSGSDRSWLVRLKQLPSNRVAVDFPDMENSVLTWHMQQSEMDKLSKLIAGSAITLSSGSTVSIEGVILDKPSIITSFDADYKKPFWNSARRLIKFTHLKKALSYGAIRVTYDFEDLDNAIKGYLNNPELHQTERKTLMQAQIGQFDGKATDRFVEAYYQLVLKYSKDKKKVAETPATANPLI